MKPLEKAPQWRHQTMLDRIHTCRAMLVIHGFLSDSENEKVKRRINKWLTANATPPESNDHE